MEFSNQQVEMSIEHLRDDDASTGGKMAGRLLRNLTESRNLATGDLDKGSLMAVTLMWSVIKSQQILDK